jgi:hypothetical protein
MNLDNLSISGQITTENFPEVGVRGELLVICLAEIGLNPARGWIYCGDIVETMNHHGLFAGWIPELMQYAATWNGDKPVVALGSIWKASPGDYYAGCLRMGDGGPELSLRDVDFDWNENDRFLAVRHQSFG